MWLRHIAQLKQRLHPSSMWGMACGSIKISSIKKASPEGLALHLLLSVYYLMLLLNTVTRSLNHLLEDHRVGFLYIAV